MVETADAISSIENTAISSRGLSPSRTNPIRLSRLPAQINRNRRNRAPVQNPFWVKLKIPPMACSETDRSASNTQSVEPIMAARTVAKASLSLSKLHRERDALATVMLTQMVSPFGIVDVDESQRIVAFREKPPLPYWLNAGVYVLSRDLMDRFPKVGDHETTLFPELVTEGRIAGFRSDAYWRSVETAKDLREVEEYVKGHGLFGPVALGTG